MTESEHRQADADIPVTGWMAESDRWQRDAFGQVDA